MLVPITFYICFIIKLVLTLRIFSSLCLLALVLL
jgi:hypothetical protein